MREEEHHIAIPVIDVREGNVLLQILAELRKQTVEMNEQTKIFQRIWGQIDLKLAGFKFTITPIDKETSMANLQIIRGGKGVKVVASPVNPEGGIIPLPAGETLAWTSSDTANSPITQDLTNDPTGLTGIGEAVGDAVGVVFTLTGTGTDGSVISDPAPPIDIIEDTKLGGFKFDETSL